MGMYSWECKGCGQDLKESEEVRLNGCVGEYDGYGRAGGFNAHGGEFTPAGWHQFCYEDATREKKLDETPSKSARNQGFGWPRQECLSEQAREGWMRDYREPHRVKYSDIPKDYVREYLESLYDDLQGRGDDPAFDPYFGEASPGDIADADFKAAREYFGERFDHEYLDDDPEKERGGSYWGDHDPGEHYWNMRERFQGLQIVIDEVAHTVLRFAKKRMKQV